MKKTITKKMKSTFPSIESMDLLKLYESDLIKAMNHSIYGDLVKIKPSKYFSIPIISFKIPYIYFDEEIYDEMGDGGRKGLFFEWKKIEIGKKKVLNVNYKEQLKEYKKRNIDFIKMGVNDLKI